MLFTKIVFSFSQVLQSFRYLSSSFEFNPPFLFYKWLPVNVKKEFWVYTVKGMGLWVRVSPSRTEYGFILVRDYCSLPGSTLLAPVRYNKKWV